MKTGRSSAATLGLIGGLVLGAWIGAEMTTMNDRVVAPEPSTAAAPAVEETFKPAPRAKSNRITTHARATAARTAVVGAPAPESPRLVMTVPMSAPELHQRMKPVLARGTKIPIAAEGFSSAEQFATLAHAARNTEIPFILLKHRVLADGQSLEDAIRASRPDIDAKTEALKAKGEARADLLSLATRNTAASN
jgi:hypothetical protein